MSDNKNATKIVMGLAEQINVEVNEEDISIAHRLPRKQHENHKKHPTIIVRCINRSKQNEICSNRFRAKDIDNFSVDNMERLYMNENLTQRRKRLQ